MKIKYICAHCGSDDIQLRKWFNPNTGEDHDWCIEDNECYCTQCQSLQSYRGITD